MSDPINEILQFGHAGTEENGDVLSPEDYAADPVRATGHQAGMARRELENTVLRQATHMAAGLAQFIAANYAPGVVDDGDLAKVVAGLQAILDAKAAASHAHAIADVTGLQTALDGKLGTAAKAADSSKLDGFPQDVANTASAVVRRNANGDFSAGTITAVLFSGTATSARYA